MTLASALDLYSSQTAVDTMASGADNPQESGSNNLPAYASGLIQPAIVEGLYILTNKKSRTVLEVEGGKLLISTKAKTVALD